MHVKICGITRTADALAAAQLGADFIGLILAPSPRRVTPAFAAEVVGVLPAGTQPVLVFRDTPLDEVAAAVAAARCGWVQLHGRESPSYLHELSSRMPRTHVIKAWEVAAPAAGSEIDAYLQELAVGGTHIDVLLLDVPKSTAHPGYDCLATVAGSLVHRPPHVWLAGGLTPDNVASAVAAADVDGADVASGVETVPGVKDYVAMQKFIAAVRAM